MDHCKHEVTLFSLIVNGDLVFAVGHFFRGLWGVLLFLILFLIISLNFEYEYVFLIIPKTTVKTLARLLELQRQLLFFVTWLTKGRLQQEFYSHLCLDQ